MNLRSQLLTDQRLLYTSGSCARWVYLKHHSGKPLMGATVCGDRSNKLVAAWSILGSSISAFLKQLRNVVVLLLRDAAILASYKAVCYVTMSWGKTKVLGDLAKMQIDSDRGLDVSAWSVSLSVSKIVSLSVKRSWTFRIWTEVCRLADLDGQGILAYIIE